MVLETNGLPAEEDSVVLLGYLNPDDMVVGEDGEVTSIKQATLMAPSSVKAILAAIASGEEEAHMEGTAYVIMYQILGKPEQRCATVSPLLQHAGPAAVLQ
jgi:hypothetical protein